MTRPLFPVVPAADALGPGVRRYTRPSAPQVLPDLSFEFKYDLVNQIGDIRTTAAVDGSASVWDADVAWGPSVWSDGVWDAGLVARSDLRVRRRREASIAQECYATLAVNRGWHRAFTRPYGIDYERAMARPSFGLLRADIENQISDQLRRIVGVASVTNFVWRQSGELAHVRFLVRLSAGGSFLLETRVPPP